MSSTSNTTPRAQGHRVKQIYVILIILYLWGSTWSYMVVFGQSFSSHVPISFINGGHTCETGPGCVAPYHFWSAIFAVVGTFLTCLNLKEQAIMQICMTCLRVVLIVLVSGASVPLFRDRLAH